MKGSPKRAPVRLLKKSDLLRALNVSKMTFEKKLADGSYPAPHVWLSESPRGRRWHPQTIRDVFGVDVLAD